MATPGARVITSNATQGILTTGKGSIFNNAGACPACCGDLCAQAITGTFGILTDGVSFRITGDGACFYEDHTVTLVGSDIERVYYECVVDIGTIFLNVEPECAGDNHIWLLVSLINDFSAPFFYGYTAAIPVTDTTTINSWSWPVEMETDPFFGCTPVMVAAL